MIKGRTIDLRATAVCIAFAAAALLMATPAGAAIFFHSPTGNIGCGVSRNGARCDIRDHSWKAPPKPGNCDVDWGSGLTVGKHGRGRFFCAGDTVLGLGDSLAYGSSVFRGRFKCTSRTDGVRCVDTKTKHGFKLSIEHANRF